MIPFIKDILPAPETPACSYVILVWCIQQVNEASDWFVKIGEGPLVEDVQKGWPGICQIGELSGSQRSGKYGRGQWYRIARYDRGLCGSAALDNDRRDGAER